ncbi:MAG: sugar ABC transporter permease [Anaerolineae bacterium]|nr:sugar ABC transporter permease [Anaerolineae bacterium]
MAAPAIVLILLFLLIPFVLAFLLAFTNQRLISPNPTEWVGARNFESLLTVRTLTLEPLRDDAGQATLDEDGNVAYPRLREYTRNNPDYPELDGMQEWFSVYSGESRTFVLASDVVFMKALVNTILFVIVIVPGQGGLALILALLINQKLRGINVFRTIYFMPVVVSMVVVALLWRFIYDGRNGLLNTLLGFVTLGSFQPVDWLGDPATAMPSLMAMSIWQGVGFHMVIWLAGLQNIPASLYEAASVEGASRWQQFRFVTWPGLRNTMVFVLVVITMQAFSLFTQVHVMTRGGPLDATQSVMYQAVQRGYDKQDISGGSTISVVFFMLVLLVSMVQRYLTRERD